MRSTRSGSSARAERGQEQHVGAAERERTQPRRGAGVAAREHRHVDALAALERAQEQRGRDASDRRRLQRMARPVATRRQRDAHPPRLAGDHEQVAVHERRDQRQQPRRAHPLEPVQHVREARRRAEQHRAHRADQRLRADGEERREPFARHVHRPEVDLLAAAHERHEHGDEEHQRQHDAGARPDDAGADPRRPPRSRASASAQAASTGHSRGGVETATTVIPAKPTILARGSSRWTALAGLPATPVACIPLIAGAPRIATAPPSA